MYQRTPLSLDRDLEIERSRYVECDLEKSLTENGVLRRSVKACRRRNASLSSDSTSSVSDEGNHTLGSLRSYVPQSEVLSPAILSNYSRHHNLDASLNHAEASPLTRNSSQVPFTASRVRSSLRNVTQHIEDIIKSKDVEIDRLRKKLAIMKCTNAILQSDNKLLESRLVDLSDELMDARADKSAEVFREEEAVELLHPLVAEEKPEKSTGFFRRWFSMRRKK